MEFHARRDSEGSHGIHVFRRCHRWNIKCNLTHRLIFEHLVPGQLYSSGRLWSLWDCDLESTCGHWGQLWMVTPKLVPARATLHPVCTKDSYCHAIPSMVDHTSEAGDKIKLPSLQLLPSGVRHSGKSCEQHVQCDSKGKKTGRDTWSREGTAVYTETS